MSNQSLRGLAVAVISAVRNQQVSFLAAAVAYYAFVSAVPLALLGLAIGQVFGDAWIDLLLARSDQFLTPAATDILARSVADSAARGGATLIGALVLLWSGSRVFRGLKVAFSQVYGTTGQKSLPGQLLDVVVVLLGIPLALLAAATVGVVLPWLDWIPGSRFLSPVGLTVVLGVVFFPLYYRFPDVDVRVREALPGTAVAAVGWATLAALFSLYATQVANFQLYGILGAALLLVTWLYLGGIIIMVGAVVNTVLAGAPPADQPDGSTHEESTGSEPAPDVAELGAEVRRLREQLEEKTVSRDALEAELEAYVRKRQRAGKATGWGPYLVLLYGTAMTLGAFYWLEGGWAILAMVVVWLSTLGLYVQLVLLGMGIKAASVPGRLLDRFRS
ncbi:MAG: YihY/virulence factor BrkB family protein [Halodesulfurarchaeum sp.]